MYRKVLIPLDRSKEAEGVLSLVRSDIAADGEVVLLHVLKPFRTQTIGNQVLLGSQMEEAERAKALSYLQSVAGQMADFPGQRRCEVTIADSVAQGILDVARRESVDLIAMYTHDRKGIARLIKGSIARDVQRKAPIEVKVFKPRELAVVS